MGDDKTEQPTPKKLREARKKGQVMHSKDLSGAFIYGVAVLVLLKAGNLMSDNLRNFMLMAFKTAVSQPWDGHTLERLRIEGFTTFTIVLAPLLGGVFVAALAINFLQAGSIFTFDTLKPSFNKLNPLEGLKRMVSLKGLVQLAKSTIILTLIFILAYQALKESARPIVLASNAALLRGYDLAQTVISTLMMRTLMIMVVLGGADFMYQKWQFNKDMMMSKEEVKNEYKEQEGDPHYKSKRKQMHKELAMGNMLKNARKADVVVTNPTRYAVAIQYDKKERGAPVVVAKGERVMADKIREIAKEEGIPIMRNVGLAQALMKVEVDEVIPEDLYEAVAEILNWVYKMGRPRK
jgi:flagellar biosynthetic protein FlhB